MAKSQTALVVGASRGLGLELAKNLHARGGTVFATGVDVGEESAGFKIVEALNGANLDLVIINAGYFTKETIDEPNFAEELQMYKTVAIGPVFITHHLHKAKAFAPNAKLVLITTEGGSIALRTKEEGGGNFGHHGSKAAENMVGKLLANDLLDSGVTVFMIHPGFMKTDMTKGVGFDQFYESGGAVEPSVAAQSALDFIATRTAEDAGTFWAPRGPRDIGEAERVLGKNLPTPLQLPW